MSLFAHRRTWRRLPDLLEEGVLAPAERTRLRTHVARCERCARRLRRMERAEALLARMPRMLFPLEPSAVAAADGRLSTLAQWGERPAPASPYGPVPAASALAMAALLLVLSVTAQEWAPVVGDMGASTTVASVMPDSSLYPLTFR